MVYLNSNNLNNASAKMTDNIKNHPFVLIGIFGLLILSILYIIFYYFKKNTPIVGFTYYSTNIKKLDPLFEKTVININECIDKCNETPKCDGITFNTVSKACLGQNEGMLRSDSNNFIAWVKDVKYNGLKLSGKIENIKQGATIISIMKSEITGTIPNSKISIPVFPDQFTFSFWINVKDWYVNYSYWRHIFHKGTGGVKKFEYHNWEQIADKVPEQCIGAWLSPFQNNIRIAVTTSALKNPPQEYDNANVEKCDCFPNEITKTIDCSKCWITDLENDPTEKINTINTNLMKNKVEYIDIPDIETNKPTHILVSFNGVSAEIYVNSKYKTTMVLSGKPQWNNGDLYVHTPINYRGELSDLIFLPGSTNMQLTKELYNAHT
jgi:hypothetical protein